MNLDPARPRLHFTAKTGWINDPLGLTFHDERYHLFYQYVPKQNVWGPDQRWGHATSTDLLHWTEGPVALHPGEGDDGVWSGSIAITAEGRAALFYTAVTLDDVQVGRIRIARPGDNTWDTWEKGNVVATLPLDTDVVAFRDPWVFHDGTCWRMIVGAGLADGTATAFLYQSDDLETWDYDGLLAARHRDEIDPLWTGAVWECPQLFRLGDDWVLTTSVWEPTEPYYEAYAIGDLVQGRFTPRTWGRLTYGPSYYAGSAYADKEGARGLIYWLRGVDDPNGQWASAHSLPHTLHLQNDRVVARPHTSIERARAAHARTLRDGEQEITAQSDIVVTLDQRSSRAALTFDGHEVHLQAAGAQLTATTLQGTWTMPIGEREIRVVLDGPIIEIFTERGTMALTVASTRQAHTLRLTGGAAARIWDLT